MDTINYNVFLIAEGWRGANIMRLKNKELYLRLVNVAFDVLFANFAVLCALFLFYGMKVSETPFTYVYNLKWYLPVYTVVSISVFYCFSSIFTAKKLREPYGGRVAALSLHRYHGVFFGCLPLCWPLSFPRPFISFIFHIAQHDSIKQICIPTFAYSLGKLQPSQWNPEIIQHYDYRRRQSGQYADQRNEKFK